MRGVLKKCWSSHNNVRTERTYGVALSLPVVGDPFVILARPIDPSADIREIVTSEIVYTRLLAPRLHRFYTQNSVYEFEVYPESDEGAPDVAPAQA